jgi:hypothetical protein
VSKRSSNGERPLLCTVTGEPFQPVRLYYAIPDGSAVTKVFKHLRCMDEDREAKCWVWLYEREAAVLTFGQPREKLPAAVHPIVIGRFALDGDRMVLAVRSTERAVQAARFFKPLLGPAVVLIRARIFNRWLDVKEAAGGLDRLDALLDADVTVIDPKDAEERFEKAMAGTKTPRQKQKALAAYREQQRRRDVPLVEDFPLHAEEETPEFRDLKFALELRMVHAYEHWRGNTHPDAARHHPAIGRREARSSGVTPTPSTCSGGWGLLEPGVTGDSPRSRRASLGPHLPAAARTASCTAPRSRCSSRRGRAPACCRRGRRAACRA